jgi:GNAT superfamily N-acetyltransferase
VRDDDNIGALYIVANIRRRGIGKHLLDKAKADRDRITLWAYEKTIEALKFYKREALVEVSLDIDTGSNLVTLSITGTNRFKLRAKF